MIIEDLGSYPGFNDFAEDFSFLVGVPIVSHANVIGGLYLCNPITEQKFTGEHLSILSLLANQSAVAIDNARLYERLGQLSVLEDRQHIAMDLHDGATQSLYAVGLQLETLLDHNTGSGRPYPCARGN